MVGKDLPGGRQRVVVLADGRRQTLRAGKPCFDGRGRCRECLADRRAGAAQLVGDHARGEDRRDAGEPLTGPGRHDVGDELDARPDSHVAGHADGSGAERLRQLRPEGPGEALPAGLEDHAEAPGADIDALGPEDW